MNFIVISVHVIYLFIPFMYTIKKVLAIFYMFIIIFLDILITNSKKTNIGNTERAYIYFELLLACGLMVDLL